MQRGLAALAIGAVVAWGAFWLTSRPVAPYLRNFSVAPCEGIDMQEPGFDPWTGRPHGWAYSCTDRDGRVINMTGPFPAELVGRQAIPLPVGFGVGSVAALLLFRLRDRSRPDGASAARAGGADVPA